jgi:uncharacterized delta-60 repeat protein
MERRRRPSIRETAERLAAATMLAALPLLVFAPIAGATAGGLDPSFGSGGLVATDFGGRTPQGIALQPDGKIIVVGGSPDVALARYNPDGTLDGTFGSGGLVTTVFGFAAVGRAVALQSDAKIVVAGTVGCCSSVGIVLARYNPDGTLDSSFDTDGKVTLPGAGDDFAQAIAMQPDGKILVGGSQDQQLLVVRFESDGSLDSTFGTGGEAVPFPNTSGAVTGLAVLPDGRILAGGYRYSGSGPHTDLEVARLNDDGSPDVTFGPDADGRVFADLNAGSDDYAFGMAVQSDGAIVLAGQSSSGSAEYNFAVARFTSGGALDPTFGTNGFVITNLGPNYEQARGVALDPDEKIVVEGQSRGDSSPSDFVVVRYNTDGTPDTSFGTGGVARIDFGGSDDRGSAVAVQPDGNIVAAGYTVSGTYKFGVARLLGQGPAATVPDTPTGVTAAAGDGQASVSWVAPSSDGGNAILQYTIDVISPAGDFTAFADGSDTSATISGLANGAQYRFRVSASNNVGTGAPSDPSEVVTPQAGAPPPQTTTEVVPASGGEATTDPGGGPTASDPITTTVLVPETPAGGSVTISETAVNQNPPPGGYQLLGQQIDITSTAATDSTNPLTIVFSLDSSLLLAATGMTMPPPGSVEVTRAETGSPVIILGCTSVGPINPDPCVSDRTYVGGDLRITILTGSASHWNTAVRPVGVSVTNTGYSPKAISVTQGSVVLWTFLGSKAHSATDNLKLGAAKTPLFDSGAVVSGRYGSGFSAAGTYTYSSSVKADRGGFTGSIAVPLQINPTSGGTATGFTVTWSSSSLSGYVFDVQYRFKRAGAKSWGSLKTWQNGASTTTGVFTPPSGVGTYAFSARLRNVTTGMASLWSPETSIPVH